MNQKRLQAAMFGCLLSFNLYALAQTSSSANATGDKTSSHTSKSTKNGSSSASASATATSSSSSSSSSHSSSSKSSFDKDARSMLDKVTLKDSNSQTVVDEGFSFTLKPPKGWVMDLKSGAKEGLAVVFYPEGSSWDKAETVMYANVVRKTNESMNADSVIASDIKMFAQKSSAQVKPGPNFMTRDNKQAVTRLFIDLKLNTADAVAYINEPKVVVTIALSAKSLKAYEQALPAFQELVGSYMATKGVVKEMGTSSQFKSAKEAATDADKEQQEQLEREAAERGDVITDKTTDEELEISGGKK